VLQKQLQQAEEKLAAVERRAEGARRDAERRAAEQRKELLVQADVAAATRAAAAQRQTTLQRAELSRARAAAIAAKENMTRSLLTNSTAESQVCPSAPRAPATARPPRPRPPRSLDRTKLRTPDRCQRGRAGPRRSSGRGWRNSGASARCWRTRCAGSKGRTAAWAPASESSAGSSRRSTPRSAPSQNSNREYRNSTSCSGRVALREPTPLHEMRRLRRLSQKTYRGERPSMKCVGCGDCPIRHIVENRHSVGRPRKSSLTEGVYSRDMGRGYSREGGGAGDQGSRRQLQGRRQGVARG